MRPGGHWLPHAIPRWAVVTPQVFNYRH
jgi:hypothetical protein